MSLVQKLFEGPMDGLSPMKTCTDFTDNTNCDSPMLDYLNVRKNFKKSNDEAKDGGNKGHKRRIRSFRRTNDSQQTNSFKLSPLEFSDKLDSSSTPIESTNVDTQQGTSLPEDEGSQDSGVGFEKDQDGDFRFIAPMGMPPRKVKIIDEDLKTDLSTFKFPSLSLTASRDFYDVSPHVGVTSPEPLNFPSLIVDDHEGDDGFLDALDMNDTSDDQSQLPHSFSSLFNAPTINMKKSDSGEFKIKKPACLKLLNRFDSLDIRPRGSQKRQNIEDDQEMVNHVQKRRRAMCLTQRSCSQELPSKPKLNFKRYHSETNAIKSALDRAEMDTNLIGDGSESFCLPTIAGKHQDLKSIAPEILAALLNQEYDHIVESFKIIDCRYPYEFEGGHIQGAKNYYTKQNIMDNLMNNPVPSADGSQKRNILIFHCEFSSERGPKMSRFLRNMDRDCNKECYPKLYYPEVYLLHAGYKNFFSSQLKWCFPQRYLPMHHEDYKHDMIMFRQKSKSWAGTKKKSRSALRSVDF